MSNPSIEEIAAMSTDEQDQLAKKIIIKIAIKRILVPVAVATVAVVAVKMVENYLDKKDTQNDPE